MCQGLIDSRVIKSRLGHFHVGDGDDDVLKTSVIIKTLSNHKETLDLYEEKIPL